MSAQFIQTWRQILSGAKKSWVLFKHGTCVILKEPEPNIRQQAVALLREWGPVHAGSPAGDFSTLTLKDDLGWVVTCHHDDILTYVAPNELSADQSDDIAIGLFGRSKRDRDATELEIIHVEDSPNAV
jgi:hypothetical protein